MSGSRIVNQIPDDLKDDALNIDDSVMEFVAACDPLEERLHIMVDARTMARYCECHIKADKLAALGTVDVPLDPDEQPEYRANRELVEDHAAYQKMLDDAGRRRTFSNLVAEYDTTYDPNHPLKIIGGQHRFSAIEKAIESGVNEYHGVKVYFELDTDQRMDVQLISNTNIAVSSDLFDRMQETLAGPELRDWCQNTGLLATGEDFADKRERGKPLTVRSVRTFILNYYLGRQVQTTKFDRTPTTPALARTGVTDPLWEKVKTDHPKLWQDKKLQLAAKAFAGLTDAQRKAFSGRKEQAHNVDFASKALNYAVIAGWAFVAGVLYKNEIRLARHFALKDQTGKDPLNAAVLAKGRHRSDSENYRGLGYRTDAKERGRFVELFYLQAEKGEGISTRLVELAIKKFHAKQALLEVVNAEEKV